MDSYDGRDLVVGVSRCVIGQRGKFAALSAEGMVGVQPKNDVARARQKCGCNRMTILVVAFGGMSAGCTYEST